MRPDACGCNRALAAAAQYWQLVDQPALFPQERTR